MSLDYPYRLRVTRAGTVTPGVYDPETGGFTPSTSGDTVIYDGPADVQDAGESIPRTASGQPEKIANATAFLPEYARDALLEMIPEDTVEVFYPKSDRSADGKVAFVEEMSEFVTIRYS